MGVVVDAVRNAMAGNPRASIEEIAEVYHQPGRSRRGAETARATNRAIADALGIHVRTVERWRTRSAERRDFNRSPHASRLRELAIPRLTARNYTRARRYGILLRLIGLIRVSEAWRPHTMPADLPGGRPNPQRVAGDAIRTGLDAVQGDDDERGEIELLRAFFAAYGLPNLIPAGVDDAGESARITDAQAWRVEG